MAQADISPPETDRPGPGWWRAAPPIAIAAAVLGTLLVALAAVRIGEELTRPPTARELESAALAEVAGRWQAWPAGRIFPAVLPYTLDVGGGESARRVGIAPDTRCEGAVEARLPACRAVLRATYLDQLQGLAITIGVAAFSDAGTAGRAAARLPRSGGGGLRALAFPGSVAARFDDPARQTSAVRQRGPYVVLSTIGYADGRPAARARQKQADLFAIAPQLADAVLTPLATPARPGCGIEGWSC